MEGVALDSIPAKVLRSDLFDIVGVVVALVLIILDCVIGCICIVPDQERSLDHM
jgi:hypothetical protein